jgi:hypothetical protein
MDYVLMLCLWTSIQSSEVPEVDGYFIQRDGHMFECTVSDYHPELEKEIDRDENIIHQFAKRISE